MQLVLAILPLFVLRVAGADSSNLLRFKPTGQNEFSFDTGVLKGTLGGRDKAKGLSSVVHIPTGQRLDASMGLLSPYRVFRTGHRFGVGAWDWPAKAEAQADGSVLVRWQETPDRPFEMSARYKLASPVAARVEFTVEAKADLPGFEVFLASYFAPSFSNASVRVSAPGGTAASMRELLPEYGAWQTFPRDDGSLKLLQDGRWKLEPNPVDWVPQPKLAAPILAVRRASHSKLEARLSADANDCFAVCAPHQSESHYSMYLSLFGRNLKAGDKEQAGADLTIDRTE